MKELEKKGDAFWQMRDALGCAVVDGVIVLTVSKFVIHNDENLQEAYRLQREGKSLIVVANHLSHLDGGVMDYILRRAMLKRPYFIAGKKLLKHPLTALLSKAVRSIYVWPETMADRGNKDQKIEMNRQAFRFARKVTTNGLTLVVFPEGTRSRTESLNRGLAGASGFMNTGDDAVILPVGIWGTEKIMGVDKRPTFRMQVALNFGKPISVSELRGLYVRSDKEARRQGMVDFAMFAIAKLLPEKYRGVYSEVTQI